MEGKVTIKTTDDGSSTLFVPELDEHYHSIFGAINESNHVFIETGFKQVNKAVIKVFEVGFGTGLNAYLTYLQKGKRRVRYYAVEKYPLELSLAQEIKLGDSSEDRSTFLKLHEVDWGEWQEIESRFQLKKVKSDLRYLTFDEGDYDVVYFDAFAPDKHPDLWTLDIFKRLYEILSPGGVLVTYCAKGVVRRMMQEVGFNVHRLPGPPPKKEMLQAQKPFV